MHGTSASPYLSVRCAVQKLLSRTLQNLREETLFQKNGEFLIIDFFTSKALVKIISKLKSGPGASPYLLIRKSLSSAK